MSPIIAETVDIFTDGSFDARSRSGSWAFIVLESGQLIHSNTGHGPGSTNNSFELLGALHALSWVDASIPSLVVNLWTDSIHVVEGCNRWRAIWRNNGWKRINPDHRARRRAIPDASSWKSLDALLDRNPNVKVAWCKGHSGIEGNDRADMLARAAVQTNCGASHSALIGLFLAHEGHSGAE